MPTSTKIRSSEFKNNKQLTSYIIPDGIKLIDSFAFAGCTSLESVVIPDSVKEIGYNAFEECPSLRKIIIPSGSKDKFVRLGLDEVLLVERD
ncbi:MAG: leucine-rich repeat domain-containing protein [Muribaculaceae bacterium]